MKQSEKSVRISKGLFHCIVEQCQRELPYESCGFLSGNVEGEITSNWQLKNEAISKNQFQVSLSTVKKVLSKMEAKKERVIILYHSHPTAAPFPSRTDLQYHPDKNVMMLIISFRNQELNYKCFKIFDTNYEEVPVLLT